MRRVYYSGYISVNTYDTRLPALKQPPLVRENRLYQADWLKMCIRDRYQCVQNTLFIFGMDQLYVFVQSAGPALGPRFDALGCGEWGSRML